MSREPWRSLDALEESPEARAFREREFPEDASTPPDAISRRHVITLLGASAALAACRRPEAHIVPYVEAPEQVVPGIARRYATTMPGPAGAWGLVVESHEGRPTKIEGNELHPASGGSSSARVQAAILDLYDPDRSSAVRRRGEASSWAALVAGWTERARTHEGGDGLALLLPPASSPTLFRLASAFRAQFPRARLVVHEPAGEGNVHEGVARALGRPLLAVHRLEKARAILAIDSDFLHADPEMIRHTRGFAAGRRVNGPEDEMSRLWAVEPVLSVTGANADHRLRLRARLVPAFTARLLADLRAAGLDVEAPAAAPAVDGLDPAFLRALVQDLLDHRGHSVVLAGPRQPASVHAAVAAMNAALGNEGATVTYHEPKDTLLPDRDGLGALVAALRAGEVKTLVVLGGNPAYDAPADLGFADAAKKAEEVVHFGTHLDETAALASWHAPLAHFLESWGDARARDGTLSVVQPLVLPLLGGKSPVEALSLLATGQDRPGLDVVRETWTALLGATDFETRWRRALHDGLLADSALPAVQARPAPGLVAALAADAAALAGQAGGADLVFRPCPKLGDGASANNAWLQELPDAITRVTWENPLLLSPKEAAARGLKDGDVVRVESGGRSLELPVFRVPGMADGTLVLHLGYGRRAAGRVGNGVGYDTYALRTAGGGDLATDARLTPVGRREALAQTQEHGSMEGRDLVRLATLARFRKEPGFAAEGTESTQLFPSHEYTKRPQWGMVIDLNACTGCNACAVACQSENNVPVVGRDQVRRGREMAWLRIDRYFTGEPAEAGAVFQPVPCMQCENAPCEQVCPVAATVHDGEGLNVMVYNRCIGTRYCSNNCPYKVRRFNFFNYTKDTPELVRMAQNPDVTVRARGVMEKCTYCVQRLNAARIGARLAGREMKDGDARTACQQACPAEAIHFGDLLDGKSDVAQARASGRSYALLAELNTRPRTTYQARLRNPHPALGGGEPAGSEGLERA